MIKRIDHVAVMVKNLEISVKFYQDNFGFKKVLEREMLNSYVKKIVFLRLEGGESEIELMHIPEAMPVEGIHICFKTDSFLADYQRLKEAGLPVVVEPVEVPVRYGEGTGHRAMFRGPDNELLEIYG